MEFNPAQYMDKAVELVMNYGPKLVLALLTLIIGLSIIKAVVGFLGRMMDKRSVDASLQPFLKSIFSMIFKAVLLISVAGMVGIETTSFVAIVGAAGLAVGLALQGSLANFAGGVLILVFKPYRVGDVIETCGFTGAVNSIQIFNTVMKTPDNKTIILPNGPVAGGSIVNYSTEATRRVDFTFGVGYDDDLKKSREVIGAVLATDTRIKPDPAPFIAVGELADSSVNFTVRVWVDAADYWGVFFDTTEAMKIAMDKAKISIPYPQRDVHMHQVK